MSSKWQIVGNVGEITESKGFYIINIADNKYGVVNGNYQKIDTIWFQCLAKFKPKVKTGDTVIAMGNYISSENEDHRYMMKVEHIGIIPPRSVM